MLSALATGEREPTEDLEPDQLLSESGDTSFDSEHQAGDAMTATRTEAAPAPSPDDDEDYAEAFDSDLEGVTPDTDPSELQLSQAPAERSVPPAPPVPWAQADVPSEAPPRSTRPELLAELESLDSDVEALEEAEELEEEPSEPPPEGGLASLTHMIERNPQPPPAAKPRIPPPPPPRAGTAPPPAPNGANGARPAVTPIPPPPRRS